MKVHFKNFRLKKTFLTVTLVDLSSPSLEKGKFAGVPSLIWRLERAMGLRAVGALGAAPQSHGIGSLEAMGNSSFFLFDDTKQIYQGSLVVWQRNGTGNIEWTSENIPIGLSTRKLTLINSGIMVKTNGKLGLT